jgi:hypothetical protein
MTRRSPAAVVLLQLVACDPLPQAAPAPQWSDRSSAMPVLAAPAVCEPQIPVLEPSAVARVDAFAGQWLRGVDDLVALDATRTLAVGRHGDWDDEGPFVVAFEPDGSVVWSAFHLLGEGMLEPVRIEILGSDAWVLTSVTDGRIGAWRYDGDGAELAAVIVEGLYLDAWVPTPTGGLLLAGREGWAPDAAPVYAELAADGALLWQGGDDLAAFDHVEVAGGVVRRLDAAGAVAWEHDPRPEPLVGFPRARGATWARLFASGDVAAVGRVMGEGGMATLLLRLDAAGRSQWSEVRPRVSVTAIHARPDGSLVLHGEARECWPQRWVAWVDDAGATVMQAQAALGWGSVLGLDGAQRPISLHSKGNALELRTYPEVMR